MRSPSTLTSPSGAASAQQGSQSLCHLRQREGLCHVVVAAGAKARDAIRYRVTSREKENRCSHAAGSECLAKVAPVGIGKADVEHVGVRGTLGLTLQGAASARDTLSLEAFLGKAAHQQAAELIVVFDHVQERSHALKYPRTPMKRPEPGTIDLSSAPERSRMVAWRSFHHARPGHLNAT